MSIERNKTLDVIRGIAIILVMVGHCITVNTNGAKETIFYNFIWSLQMPLFFIISGYVTKYSRKISCFQDLLKYIVKRSIAYMLPWTIWTVIVKCLIVDKNVHIFAYLKNISHSMDSGYWFLFALWSICLIYGIASFLANKITKNQLYNNIWMCIFSIVESIGLVLLGAFAGMQFLGIKYTLYYLIYFYIGILTGILSNTHIEFKKYWNLIFLPVLICYMLLICNINFYTANDTIINIIIRIVTSLLGCFVVFSAISVSEKLLCGKIGSFLSFVGCHSLELYLIHYLFLSKIKSEVIPAFLTTDGVILCILNFILMITASVIIIWVTSSNKLSKFILFGKNS